MAAHTGRRFKVAEITELIRATLEPQFYDIAVEGEVSNFRPSSTGHYYFTLKDNDAVLSAVMFRGRLGSLRFAPEDGQLVTAFGSLSVYAKRGVYQIVVERMEKSGEGELLATIEERKRRLAAEGLFDAARKRPLPLLPQRVAVVTSPTGAAIRDILNVTARRNAGVDLVILPAPVQGEGAADRIARQIERANWFHLADVIIVSRGGGSLEDLLPFSEEVVVRAVALSGIPVISAVGHEVDVSLSDLAADVRAATPSAAAELVTARRDEILDEVHAEALALGRALRARLERVRLLLERFSAAQLERNFRQLTQPLFLRLDDAREGLARSIRELAGRGRHRLELATRELEAGSPEKILRKGYAVVTDGETNRLITSAGQTRRGASIGIRLSAGALKAEVQEIMR